MIEMALEEFEQSVADALDALPEDLGTAMENVAIVVDDGVAAGRLLGLYQGVPLTSRGDHYFAAAPDRITIYKAAICRACESSDDVVALVRKVVIHEVGHHFGIDDARLEELGWG